jgi:hypothetical protein
VCEIATALGALDVIASPAGVAEVVRQLPREISSRLAAQPGRQDVYLASLVRACFEYPAGLNRLLEILDYHHCGDQLSTT